ncbi:hypothetical protein ACFX1Q_000093 [Malus domestica]
MAKITTIKKRRLIKSFDKKKLTNHPNPKHSNKYNNHSHNHHPNPISISIFSRLLSQRTAKDSLSLTAFTTCEALVAGFQPFVEIEDYNLVLDKATSKPKGYGFVQFKTCCGAIKALKNPKKNVGNRIASCQLASVSSATNTATTTTSSSALSNSGSRKVYVNSVPHDVDGEKLRAFIKKFGEIETGPVGLDSQTRKSRDYALFIYKTLKGTKKALEKPFKPSLAIVVAAQNMAMFSQHPSLNLLYNGLMGNVGGRFIHRVVNLGMMAQALNSGQMGGALNPYIFLVSQMG